MPTKEQIKLDNTIKRIRGLHQNKILPEHELVAKAQRLLMLKDKLQDLELEVMFNNHEERKSAKTLASKYLVDYSIETVSDINNLKQLLYLEILNFRLQKKVNDEKKKDKLGNETDVLDYDSIELIHKNLKEIINLKDKLGLTRSKEQEKNQDALAALQAIKKKYKVWLQNNQASRQLLCPHCTQYMLLKIKVDSWEAAKHPFFKDRILANEHLITLYLAKKITKEDVALILGTSSEYTDWLVEHVWKLNPHFKNLEDSNEKLNSDNVDSIDTTSQPHNITFTTNTDSDLQSGDVAHEV